MCLSIYVSKTRICSSTSDPRATKVGMEILKQGGTAVDAAIAISYTLGVVEPYGSGLGEAAEC